MCVWEPGANRSIFDFFEIFLLISPGGKGGTARHQRRGIYGEPLCTPHCLPWGCGGVVHRACLCGLSAAGALSNPPRKQGPGAFLTPGNYCFIPSLCSLATGIVSLLQVTAHLSVWERMKGVRAGDSLTLVMGTYCHHGRSWHLCLAVPRTSI